MNKRLLALLLVLLLSVPMSACSKTNSDTSAEDNVSTTVLEETDEAVTFFSTKLSEDYGLGDLYSLVGTSEWTFDIMLSLAAVSSAETDGDGTVTEEDQYGICGGYNMNSLLIVSAGYRFTAKNDDSTHRSTGYTEELLDFNNLLLDTYSQNWYYNCYVYGDKNHFNDAKDSELSGILLEALNYKSKKTVLPAFYDGALFNRSASTPEASAILDTFFVNAAFDSVQNRYTALSISTPLHTSIGINENYVSNYIGLQNMFDKNLTDIFTSIQKNNRRWLI